MSATITPAYITTIRPDRTIVLPDEMAVGATVAVVVLPSISESDSAAREARFEAILSAISNASNVENAASISDKQSNELIKKAIAVSEVDETAYLFQSEANKVRLLQAVQNINKL
jgi:hypothetical protein